MRFGSPEYLYLLFGIPLLILFLRFAGKRRLKALSLFGDPALLFRLMPGYDSERRRTKLTLIVVVLSLAILAMAHPQLGEKRETVKRTGIDIIVALDTSASMLAEDIKPDRLAAAKREIRGLINGLDGDRIGLLAFAGTSAMLCPLTLDYGAALMILGEIDTDMVSVPGSNLADAIQKAQESFVKGEQQYKVLVIITDGQNTVGDPVAAARQVYEQDNIRVFCIGLGSEGGAPIPMRNERGELTGYKKDSQGNLVLSQLDESVLKQIVSVSEGVYYQASQSLDELDIIYEEVRSMEEKELKSQMFVQHIERFQWLLVPALILLMLEFAMPESRRRKSR